MGLVESFIDLNLKGKDRCCYGNDPSFSEKRLSISCSVESCYKRLPGTHLRARPHIHSKLTTWKRTFASLSGALSRSGVGFNNQTHMMDIDDETWNLVIKADKNAAGMQFKSFPLYPIWTEIFGKDRANGKRAENVLDASLNLLREDLVAEIQDTDEGSGH